MIERKIKNMNYWIEDFKTDGFSTAEDIAKVEATRDEWQSYIDFADAKEGK
ncbi:MAG: hypothetical protein OSB10_04400 [Planctomycetota bacterium]|nr:hypothetical protein [Planctomycetota bacterium]